MITGAWGRRAARCAGLALLTAAAACGGGGGSNQHTFDLPAGTAFDATASDRVLLVVEAKNQCGDVGNCAPTPAPEATPAAGTCDVGNGNTRGLALYRLGSTGRFLEDPDNPGTALGPEQTIATADNPRRVLVSPADPRIVYVATNERVQVFRLAPAGGSRCIAQTRSEREADPRARNDLDPVDFALDPTIGNGVLYVAGRGSNRIDAYPIADDGTIGAEPASCIIGASDAEYTSLSLLTRDFVAASGRTRIEIFRRVEGLFPPPTPAPSSTPTPAPTPGCFGVQLVSIPVSFIGAAIVTDTAFTPSSSMPIGELFISEEVSRRLFTFNIDANGTINGKETSSTKRDGFYQDLLLRDVGSDRLVYASVFQEGRVAVFRLENGLLPESPFSKTEKDPKTLPVGLAIDASGTFLYVAEAGVGRIDGFRLQPDGGIGSVPETSTEPVTIDGREVDSFPSDIAIIPAP
jgi:6-phosphogluconolactonase (cycloisomerase 2 family)